MAATFQTNSRYKDRSINTLVSVIIPTRNRCDLVLRAIQSVFEQTYPHWEIVVVDDGSADDTVARIKALKHPKITLQINESRRGAGYCRHIGVTHAQGDFIAFLDSDDRWLPDKLAKQLAAAEANQSADGNRDLVIVCPMAIIRDQRQVNIQHVPIKDHQPIADYLYGESGAALQTSCLIVSGHLGRLVRFDPELQVNQDTDYLLRLEQAGAHFVYVPEALYVHDITARMDRISNDPQLVNHSLAWFAERAQQWSTKTRRGFYLADTAIRLARTGHRFAALKYYFKGLSIDTPPRYALRQLMMVLGGGQMPTRMTALYHKLRQHE